MKNNRIHEKLERMKFIKTLLCPQSGYDRDEK